MKSDLFMTNELTRSIVKNFLAVVVEMRKAQKEYFRTRDKQALIESKRLEAAVDAIRIPEMENMLKGDD